MIFLSLKKRMSFKKNKFNITSMYMDEIVAIPKLYTFKEFVKMSKKIILNEEETQVEIKALFVFLYACIQQINGDSI